ncbi:MAG: TetR/AcrR family transcriptional regulator [Solirubrobacterales bacterium]|nr:TetR/AcrR family transcriptional regulator [Solirubrobacterales bacterium]
MARRGLTHDLVVEAATRIADARGLDAVTVAAVAADLGVRPPSLYNHVGSVDALRQAIGAAALLELAAAMSIAAAGLAHDDALLAIARTQRAYALRHPGAYAATGRIVGVKDEHFLAGGAAVVDVLLAVLRGYGLTGEEAIHGARAVRSAVHGFVSLELAGGYAMALDPEASFDWTVRALAAGLRAAGS